MKSKKSIYFILAILAISAGAWWYFKMRKTEDSSETATGENATKGIDPAISQIANKNTRFKPIVPKYPIKKNDSGDYVKVIQGYLNTKYNTKLKIDGIFGSDTENALVAIFRNKEVNQSQYETFWNLVKNLK